MSVHYRYKYVKYTHIVLQFSTYLYLFYDKFFE